MIRQFVAFFVFTVIVGGMAVAICREHPAPQVLVDKPHPVTPAVLCQPPMSHWQFKQRRVA